MLPNQAFVGFASVAAWEIAPPKFWPVQKIFIGIFFHKNSKVGAEDSFLVN